MPLLQLAALTAFVLTLWGCIDRQARSNKLRRSDFHCGECGKIRLVYLRVVLNRVFKNTEFYGGGKTSENSLNEPAELSLRCLAKTENDHVCRCLATLALEMWVSLLEG